MQRIATELTFANSRIFKRIISVIEVDRKRVYGTSVVSVALLVEH